MTTLTVTQEISRKKVWLMFDRIAHRYDLLNRLLSMRQDVAWRKKLARHLPDYRPLYLLDLATGTGDVAITLMRHGSEITRALGVDMSEKMLDEGRQKLKKLQLTDAIRLQTGDATALDLPDNTFDVTTIAFGIRNVMDPSVSLREMIRVLKPGGRSLILEFSLPENVLMRRLYLFYFRHVLPKIGALISGDSYAYNYLNQTVETFPYGDAFCRLMEEAGFKNVSAHPLTFGIATIYRGDKPAATTGEVR